jgi:hypothetical protein
MVLVLDEAGVRGSRNEIPIAKESHFAVSSERGWVENKSHVHVLPSFFMYVFAAAAAAFREALSFSPKHKCVYRQRASERYVLCRHQQKKYEEFELSMLGINFLEKVQELYLFFLLASSHLPGDVHI